MNRRKKSAIILALGLALSARLAPARAQVYSPAGFGSVARTLTVPRDQSVVFQLGVAAAEVVVAQPKTLEVVATTDHGFYARGLAVGTTNVLVYDRSHHLTEVLNVRVGYDTDALTSDLAAAMPGEHVIAINCADGVLLTGRVANDALATRAKQIAERYAPDHVTSALSVEASQQVLLEVRVLEVSRNALKDFGVDAAVSNASGIRFASGSGLLSNQQSQGMLRLSGSYAGNTLDVTLKALEQKGVIHTLAKPNLVALSGEEASFLAGGEFPYPVPQGLNQVTIAFRAFGVTLNFTPHVLDGGMIKLKVSPEVSALDYHAALVLNGVSVPALTSRRASTTVELHDGESFTIAGLFQQGYANNVSQIPWASDVPVLGALFRSTDWQKQQTELVIIATVHLVKPALPGDPAPTLGISDQPDAIELLLEGKTARTPMAPPQPGGRGTFSQ